MKNFELHELEDEIPRMMTEVENSNEENKNLKLISLTDNDWVLYDSYRKFENKEDTPKIPSLLEFPSDGWSSESSNKLRIELKEWEHTSNTSSAMTPKILREQEKKDAGEPMQINGELNFCDSIGKL